MTVYLKQLLSLTNTWMLSRCEEEHTVQIYCRTASSIQMNFWIYSLESANQCVKKKTYQCAKWETDQNWHVFLSLLPFCRFFSRTEIYSRAWWVSLLPWHAKQHKHMAHTLIIYYLWHSFNPGVCTPALCTVTLILYLHVMQHDIITSKPTQTHPQTHFLRSQKKIGCDTSASHLPAYTCVCACVVCRFHPNRIKFYFNSESHAFQSK